MMACTSSETHNPGKRGNSTPRQPSSASSTSAAMAVRPAVSVAGGMVSTATLIWVKAPPHSAASTTNRARSAREAVRKAILPNPGVPSRLARTARGPTARCERMLLDPQPIGKQQEIDAAEQRGEPGRAEGVGQERDLQRDDQIVRVRTQR